MNIIKKITNSAWYYRLENNDTLWSICTMFKSLLIAGLAMAFIVPTAIAITRIVTYFLK